MACIGIARACSSQHMMSKKADVVTPKLEALRLGKKEEEAPVVSRSRFSEARWKNGTWDLNMFVKQGRIDWGSVIIAEAKRRKFLEVYPETSRNEEAVVFMSGIIPWWAWILHSHLPEAELLNGRAAMVGFFMAYLVDAMTGLDVVGQTGNFICKAALLLTVVGVLLFRRKEDIQNIKKLADEATYYDKQWQASWENPDSTTTTTVTKQK